MGGFVTAADAKKLNIDKLHSRILREKPTCEKLDEYQVQNYDNEMTHLRWLETESIVEELRKEVWLLKDEIEIKAKSDAEAKAREVSDMLMEKLHSTKSSTYSDAA